MPSEEYPLTASSFNLIEAVVVVLGRGQIVGVYRYSSRQEVCISLADEAQQRFHHRIVGTLS
jgi:hypothetical protein